MRLAQSHIPQKLPHMHHVYKSLSWYFDELRQTANIPGSAFWWPCNALGFNNSFDYAFELKNPGVAMTAINTKPPPDWLAEAMSNKPESVVIGFHGSAPQNANGIARDGLRPTPGAGSDELLKVFGFDITGTYVATTATLAWSYPQEGQDARKRHHCGYLVVEDGSLPQKLLVTCAGLSDDIMFENRGQRVFPSDRLHILSMT